MCDTPMLENDGIGREGTASDYTGHECGDRRWVQSSRANLVLSEVHIVARGGLEYVGLADGAMHSMQSIN